MSSSTHRNHRLSDGLVADIVGSAALTRPTDPSVFGARLADSPAVLRDLTERARLRRRYELLLENATGAAGIIDETGRLCGTSHGLHRYIGDAVSLVDSYADGCWDEPDLEDLTCRLRRLVDGGPRTTDRLIARLGAPGTEKRWVEVVATNHLDDPAVQGIVFNLRDADDAMRAAEKSDRFSSLLETATDAAVLLDRDRRALWDNGAMPRLLGRDDAEGSTIADVVPPEITEQIQSAARARQHGLELDERRERRTMLPNRLALIEHLDVQLGSRPTDLAVFHFDLDRVHETVEAFGHDAGDRLVQAGAQLLAHATGPSERIFHVDSSEFVVVREAVVDAQEAAVRGAELLDGLRGTVDIDGFGFSLTASVGVASGFSRATELLASAGAAVREARRRGGDRIEICTDLSREESSVVQDRVWSRVGPSPRCSPD